MAITFSTTTQAARPETSHSVGGESFDLAAGKSLKIETSPAGEELLDIQVPAGEAWFVTIDVSIAKTAV